MSRRWMGLMALVPALLVVAGCSGTSGAGEVDASDGPSSASSAAAPSSGAPPPKVGDEIASVPLPGSSLGVGTGFGSLWVATDQDSGGALVRVDPAKNEVLATIPVGGFPVGTVAGFGSIWQAIHADGTLARIDPVSNKVIATISVGAGPSQVAVDGGFVWVSDQDSTLAAIDPKTNRRVRLVRVGRGNEFRALVAGAGSIWTANNGGGISRVDSASGKILATIPIPACCDGDR